MRLYSFNLFRIHDTHRFCFAAKKVKDGSLKSFLFLGSPSASTCWRTDRLIFLTSRRVMCSGIHSPKYLYLDFFIYFYVGYIIQHCFICRPSDFTVSEDAGIEPRTVTTLALAARRSNHLAGSHPLTRSHPYFDEKLTDVTVLCILTEVGRLIFG